MIYDISPSISPSLAVWPGDTAPSREVQLDIARGDSVTLSTLRTTVHAGAHADAPSHYGADGAPIDERDLSMYIGPCQLIKIAARPGMRIGPGDLDGLEAGVERLLLATGTYRASGRFDERFAALDPALVDWCHTRGVRLVGVDTPSVELFDDRELLAHKRFLAHDMAILEGLALDGVAPGRYELIALPLKLVGFDGSPVRAVLRTP